MKFPASWGMILLAVWLIVSGAVVLLSLTFAHLPVIMAILAIAAGVLLLIGR